MDEKITAVLEGLNEEQKKAVCCTDGPVLIVAGAGSGKTRVLTSRIAYILEKGVPANRILALTFTKKAAAEMKERIAAMVGDQVALRLVMGTFHSVFIRFLRRYAELLGYPSNFTIYDTSDSQSAIKACVKQLGLDDKIYKPRDVLSRISMAKNNLITPGAYRNDSRIMLEDSRSKKPRMADIYTRYQENMKKSGVMDFDDILVNMNILLRDSAEACEELASRFSYIMVDEYQDTNFAQYLIMKKLAAPHHNICVVGDDCQSIYAFRGAKIENILNFNKDYPDRKIFRLERNYRSTSVIVDAANSIIAHNEGRIPKNCYAVGEEGEKIKLLQSYTEQLEGAGLAEEIVSRIRKDSAQYQDFAILYRTNSQSRAIEEQLRKRNIPYMIYSGNSFFERAEVKDLMAYFKLCVNPSDNESFRRIVNKPARGIGGTTFSLVEEMAEREGMSLFQAGTRVPKVKPFTDMIASLSAMVETTDAHELAVKIANDSGLYAYYKADNSVEGLSRMSNIEELLNSVAVYVEGSETQDGMEEAIDGAVYDGAQADSGRTLADYLENISLLSNVDAADDEESTNKVALMTIHSAKGLEFPYVLVAGMEENIFPSVSMMSSERDLEEERRLFYVAVTRAQKFVMLSFAQTRMHNGKHESNAPSRFIREIDSRYIANPLPPRRAFADMEDEDEGFNRNTSRYGRTGANSSMSYGRSGPVQYVRGNAASRSAMSKPAQTQRPAAAAPARPKPRPADPNFKPSDMAALRAGQRVEHQSFGFGRIDSISGRYPDMRATVTFDAIGEKVLLLKYAKLRIIDG